MNQKKRSQRNTPKVVYPFMNALLTLFQMIALYSGEVKKKVYTNSLYFTPLVQHC